MYTLANKTTKKRNTLKTNTPLHHINRVYIQQVDRVDCVWENTIKLLETGYKWALGGDGGGGGIPNWSQLVSRSLVVAQDAKSKLEWNILYCMRLHSCFVLKVAVSKKTFLLDWAKNTIKTGSRILVWVFGWIKWRIAESIRRDDGFQIETVLKQQVWHLNGLFQMLNGN